MYIESYRLGEVFFNFQKHKAKMKLVGPTLVFDIPYTILLKVERTRLPAVIIYH